MSQGDAGVAFYEQRPIVCLGWGSLIWSPTSLPTSGSWEPDGPLLPIEFARQSSGGRVTLVITPGAKPVQVLWTALRCMSLDEARSALQARERATAQGIGFWSGHSSSYSPFTPAIADWGTAKGLGGVVWTALRPKWDGVTDRVPTEGELIAFLTIQGAGSEAEQYVRKAPVQVRTTYRCAIERQLGWWPDRP